MKKLYGESLRKDAGFVKVMKSVASKNARILESRAGKHAPELKRVVKEVKGTFEKVFEETADVVEEFLAKCTVTTLDLLRRVALIYFSPSFLPPCSPSENLGSGGGHEDSLAAIEGEAGYYVRCSLRPSSFLTLCSFHFIQPCLKRLVVV